MVDCRVFEKIEQFIKLIDSNKDKKITNEELNNAKDNLPSIWFEKINEIVDGKEVSTNKIYTALGAAHTEEIDPDHTPDKDSDGGKYRFANEDKSINHQQALERAKFFIERSVEKWFTLDINRDGVALNIEEERWNRLGTVDCMNDGDISEEEFASKYNLIKTDEIIDDYKSWIEYWKNEVLYSIAYDYGVELTESDIKELENYAKIQINRMLVKPGEGNTASLYNRCGNDAYTRLVTPQETESCCGGDITPPPAGLNKLDCAPVFGPMELTRKEFENVYEIRVTEFFEEAIKAGYTLNLDGKNYSSITKEDVESIINKYEKPEDLLNVLENKVLMNPEMKERLSNQLENLKSENFTINNADEVKNRLAWAAFPAPPKEVLAKEPKLTVWEDMFDKEYREYHESYMNIRNMTAAEYRELLKPENSDKLKAFEEHSAMSVQQIVDYIDIVESVTGKNFDDNDWSINRNDYYLICNKINGTYGDETVLDGKTEKDILPERKELYDYLKKEGLLLPQFLPQEGFGI